MADKVAVITGAGSGIGRASALALMATGWSVALLGRRKDALEETAGMATGGHSLILPTDVSSPEQVAATFAAVKAKFGHLDMLFNNAGGNVPTTNFGDMTWEGWKSVVDVNLNGMFLCANAAFRAMRDQTPQGGRIALDGRQFDIASSQIDIGNAATPMTARSVNGQMQPYGQMAVEPRMDVAHVGAQVAFMANLPLESNIQFVTIMATKMPWIGRG
jgi:NAD(P)-dependent dehydrogenase (short-subunit alcohol dehydrogenase family)